MPKLSTFRTFPYTAELWDYSRRSDPTGAAIFTYFRDRVIEVSITQTLFGKLTISFRDQDGDIRSDSQLRAITHKTDGELYPNSVWTLTGLVPIITPFGTREGYRADAKWTFIDGVA